MHSKPTGGVREGTPDYHSALYRPVVSYRTKNTNAKFLIYPYLL